MEGPPENRHVNYFFREIIFLKVFGVSLNNNKGLLHKLYESAVVVAMVSFMGLNAYDMFQHEFEESSHIFLYLIGTLLSFYKLCTLLKNRHRIRNLLVAVQKKPFLPDLTRGGEIEEQLVNECLLITKVQNITYWTAMLGSIIIASIYTAIIRIRYNNYRKWTLPYGPLSMFDTSYSPNYEIVLVFQVVCILYFAIMFVTTDLLAISILVHLCYQFRMLQNQIRITTMKCSQMKRSYGNVKLGVDELDFSRISYAILQQELQNIVEYHLSIIGVVDELNGIFSNMFLMLFFSALLFLCLSAYHVSNSEFSVTLVKYILEASSIVMQTFLIAFWCNKVSDESQEVGMAAFHSNFYGTDLRYQKGLQLIIRRSLNPSTLSAGMFTTIGISTFAWSIKSSYSAMMLLLNMEDKDA